MSGVSEPIIETVPLPGTSPRSLALRSIVAKRYAWLVSGSVYYAAVQWIVLTLLARQMGAESVGRYAYALAITGPVYMFSNMQLAQVFASDAARHYRSPEYAGARIVTAGSSLVLCLIIGAIAAEDRVGTLVVAVIAIAKCLEALGDVTFGGAQRSGLVHRIAFSGIIRGTLILALVSAALIARRDVLLVVVMIAAANMLVLPFDLRTIRLTTAIEGANSARELRHPWTFNPALLRRLLWFALPLGIVAVAINLIGTVPRIALREVSGLAQLGHFAVLSYFVVGARMLVVPMSSAFIPSLGAAFVAGRKRHFVHLVGVLLGIAAVLGAGGWIVAHELGRWILSLLYGAEYAPLAPQLAILMIGAGFGYVATFCEDALTATRHLRPKAVLVVVVAMMTVVVAGPLILRFGFEGAVLSVVFASVVEGVGSACLLLFALRDTWLVLP